MDDQATCERSSPLLTNNWPRACTSWQLRVHVFPGQGAATGVRFTDPGGRQLASAGNDSRLLLTDRRAGAAAAACASTGASLTALDAHEEGAWLAAGTAGAVLGCPVPVFWGHTASLLALPSFKCNIGRCWMLLYI